MIRKWICMLWVMAVMCGAMGEGNASETTGTIRIIPQWCGTPLTEGKIALRRVGIKKDAGYYLTDGLANWSVETGEMESLDGSGWKLRESFEEEIAVSIEGEEGALFVGLEEGVYLVRQLDDGHGGRRFEPFLLTIPDENLWDITRTPNVIRQEESPKTGDRPAPIIGAMGLGLSVAVLMVLVDERKK